MIEMTQPNPTFLESLASGTISPIHTIGSR